jgi:hypothetical protein
MRLDQEGLIIKISNKNREREKRRAKKRAREEGREQESPALRRAKRTRLARRVVRDDEEDEDEDEDEDEVVDPWFREHRLDGDVMVAAPLQKTMVRYAKAIAGKTMLEEWRALFAYWRAKGHLTQRSGVQDGGALDERGPGVPIKYQALYQAYGEVSHAEASQGWMTIANRCRMVNLWHYYRQALDDDAEEGDEQARERGQTRRAMRKQDLFRILHPQMRDPTDGRWKTAWGDFTRRLSGAKRWHTLQQELGYGILGLIPHSTVSNSWVERKLREPQFHLWVKAIKHFNPRCLEVITEWGKVLVRAEEGRRPSRQQRALEMAAGGLTGDDEAQRFFEEETDGAASADEHEAGQAAEPPGNWPLWSLVNQEGGAQPDASAAMRELEEGMAQVIGNRDLSWPSSSDHTELGSSGDREGWFVDWNETMLL